MTLRHRVLLGCGVIAAVLLCADLLLATTLRSMLLERVDNQLHESAARIGRLPAVRLVEAPQMQSVPFSSAAVPEPGLAAEPQLITDLFIGIVKPDEKAVDTLGGGLGAPNTAFPEITPEVVTAHAAPPGSSMEPFTVPAADGSQSWRVVATQAPGQAAILVGMSLEEMGGTLRQVMGVAGLLTLLVLAALAAVAVWMIRLGVRPMTAMAGTAEAIAAGEYYHRVQVAGTGTEAARLGASLNTMLEKIEGAFAARTASEERLRRFVADASHELRTPLTSIMGYAELWRNGGLEDEAEAKEAMRRLDEEARRMGVLVDDLLLLAHLDEGRPLEQNPVALDRVAADAVADARAIEPDRPISSELETVEVTGDDARLRQIAANLLANARVHTPAGTPVHVKVSAQEGRAMLEVADEGPGIDEAHRRKLFERFYRADSARSRTSGGSGLGLAIVAAVAEAHGGSVAVDERPGGGARFRVELPAQAP